jgi:hypothetical protein
MSTKRGEKRNIDDNERISKRNIDDNERISRRNTEKSSEAEKRIRVSDDNVEGIYDMICIIFINKKLYTV